jgi:hypothetical protein
MIAEIAHVPEELANALRVLLDENIGDMWYAVRDREMKDWEGVPVSAVTLPGPRVIAFGKAVEVIRKYAEEVA